MKTHLKQLAALLLIAALALALTACGGGKTDDLTYFRLGFSEGADSFNVLYGNNTVAAETFRLVYDPLYRQDENYEMQPCVAAALPSYDADSMTYTIKLRQDVKFTDGTPLTAADVVSSFYWLKTWSYFYSYMFDSIDMDTVAAPDDYTVSFSLNYYTTGLLEYLCYIPVLPAHIWDGSDEQSEDADLGYAIYAFDPAKFVGSGPYKYYADDDSSVTLVRNEEYWGENNSDVDVFVFVYNVEPGAALAALEGGELDGVAALTSSDLGNLERSEVAAYTMGSSYTDFVCLSINMHDAQALADINAANTEANGAEAGEIVSGGNTLLCDAEVRRAINQCIDREYVYELCYNGLGAVGSSFISPNNDYYYDVTGSESYLPCDTAAAAARLEAAGYTDADGDGIRADAAGNKLSFSLFVEDNNTEDYDAALYVAKQCKEAGIEINVSAYDQDTLWSYTDSLQYDMYFIEWAGDLDPNYLANCFKWESGLDSYALYLGGSNESGFCSAEYNELYRVQLNATDDKTRGDALARMQEIVYDECPYVIIAYPYNLQAYNKQKWTGVLPIGGENGLFFETNNIYNYLNLKLAA